MPTITKKKAAKSTASFKQRAVDNAKIYNSPMWRSFSKHCRLESPYCVMCEKGGIIRVGNVSDHIIPVSQGGEIYDRNNVQTLCHSCHNRKSQQEGQAIKRAKEWEA